MSMRRLTDEQRREIIKLRDACESEPGSSETLDGALRHAFNLGYESVLREQIALSWEIFERLARAVDREATKYMLKEEMMGTKNNPGKFDCHTNALPDEPLFTLLARDPQAHALVRAWADARLSKDEAKAHEAYECALAMEAFRRDVWMKQAKRLSPGDVIKRTRALPPITNPSHWDLYEDKHARVQRLRFEANGDVIVGLSYPLRNDIIEVELDTLARSAVHEDGRPIATDGYLG